MGLGHGETLDSFLARTGVHLYAPVPGKAFQDRSSTPTVAASSGSPVGTVLEYRNASTAAIAFSDARRPTWGSGAGLYWTVGDEVDDYLFVNDVSPAQEWYFALTTSGYSLANEVAGYGEGFTTGRIFPDTATWFSGDAGDVCAFTSPFGTGRVNGVETTVNAAVNTSCVISLTRSIQYIPANGWLYHSSGSPGRYWMGKIFAVARATSPLSAPDRTSFINRLAALSGAVL